MKVVRNTIGFFIDYPFVTNLALLLIVAAHYLLAIREPALDVAGRLADAGEKSGTLGDLTSLALGAASIAAMVGGFAGVVVIFGLGGEYDRFRVLRQRGGRRLRASWISVVLVSFAAAFLSVVAAVITVAFSPVNGMWVFEAALLLSAHGAVRLTWLLSRLARLVDAADEDARRDEARIPAEELFRN